MTDNKNRSDFEDPAKDMNADLAEDLATLSRAAGLGGEWWTEFQNTSKDGQPLSSPEEALQAALEGTLLKRPWVRHLLDSDGERHEWPEPLTAPFRTRFTPGLTKAQQTPDFGELS